jgi:hypothetical protein
MEGRRNEALAHGIKHCALFTPQVQLLSEAISRLRISKLRARRKRKGGGDAKYTKNNDV